MGSFPIIVITGSPGVGKTTLVKKIVSRVQDASPSAVVRGFYTQEVRQGGERTGFDVVTISGQRAVLAAISSDGAGRGPKVGRYSVNVASFEAVALPQLNEMKCNMMVIDEVGKMELFSKSFTSSVSRLIDNQTCALLLTIPVPGRGSPIPLVERIRSLTSAKLYQITKANRNEAGILDSIVALLTAKPQ